jgi:HEAT repeat protein/putative zinc finger protein
MKCDWVQQNIMLHVYDELADDARYELDQHVARCEACAAELAAAREFRQTMATVTVVEPSPNLLASSRMRLQEALETTQQGGLWTRLTFDPGIWLRQVRFSPALAAVLLLGGFGGGTAVTFRAMKDGQPIAVDKPVNPQDVEANITGIRSITPEPGTNRVNIKYDTVNTKETAGSLNDVRIQQLLLFAAQNNTNSGVRVDSVDLLRQRMNDSRVREALVYALRYDNNPGVRLKALEGLGSYVKDDVRVRDAVLETLTNDANPGLRTEALRVLEPVRADASVRATLERLAAKDSNKFIRDQSRAQLAQLPELD